MNGWEGGGVIGEGAGEWWEGVRMEGGVHVGGVRMLSGGVHARVRVEERLVCTARCEWAGVRVNVWMACQDTS